MQEEKEKNDAIQDRLRPQIFKSRQKKLKNYESAGEFILSSLDRHKNAELFIDCESDRRWTGNKMGRLVRRIACWLIDELDMKPGQVACISYEHGDKAVALGLAIICAGGVVAAIDPNDPYPEILYYARRIRPSFIFCHNYRENLVDQLRNDLAEITKSNPYNLKFAAVDGDEFEKFLIDSQNNANDEHLKDKFDHLPVKPHGNCKEMIAIMSASSGTTGMPKVITINHENCFFIAQNSYLNHKKIFSKNQLHNTHDYDDDDDENEKQVTVSCLASLYYATGRLTILRALESAYRIALIRADNIDDLIKYVNKYEINCAYLGVGVFQSLVNTCLTRVPNHPNLDSIVLTLATGGHVSSIDQVRKFYQLYPNIRYGVQCYGTTEANVTAIANYQPVGQFLANPNNCGQLLANYQLKIVDIKDDDKEKLLGADQRGIIHIGGPHMFSGYYDPELVPEPPHLIRTEGEIFDSDGFYITGDIGWIDSRTGDLYIEGRLKELMSCRGSKKVFPHELETIVMQHDQVAECVVLGIKGVSGPEIGLDCPRAFIVPTNVSLHNQIYQPIDGTDEEKCQFILKKNGKITSLPSKEIYELAKTILEFAHAHIGWRKQLTGGICVLREIPRLRASGKINKRYLRSLTHESVFIYGSQAELESNQSNMSVK